MTGDYTSLGQILATTWHFSISSKRREQAIPKIAFDQYLDGNWSEERGASRPHHQDAERHRRTQGAPLQPLSSWHLHGGPFKGAPLATLLTEDPFLDLLACPAKMLSHILKNRGESTDP